MDSSQNSPASKRRKFDTIIAGVIDLTEDEASSVNSPASADLSYDTIPTLPLYAPQNNFTTQPTQIIDRNGWRRELSPEAKPEIQVAASSPTAAPSNGPQQLLRSGATPAGTAFRLPNGVVRGPKKLFKPNINDDPGPCYMGGSSDEDTQQRQANDIKSTRFISGEDERVAESPQAKEVSRDIRSITQSALYKPATTGSIYNPRNRDMPYSKTTAVHQAWPRPMPIPNHQSASSESARVQAPKSTEFSLKDIDDFQTRQKVKRMREIMTTSSVEDCLHALSTKKGNLDDAMDFLTQLNDQKGRSRNPSAVKIYDLTSDDELGLTPEAPKMKQQLKERAQPLWNKYGGPARAPAPSVSSQVTALVPKVNPDQERKKERKLMRGPRPRSPSPGSPLPKDKQVVQKRVAPVVIDSDESVAESSSEAENLDQFVLQYLNTCTSADLVDTASITPEVATHLLAQRPFRSARAVRAVVAAGGKSKRPIGDKIYDKCENMLLAYRTVDELVKKCRNVGLPLAQEMKAWGVDVFGMKNELDLAALEGTGLHCDSGIGTPLSELEDGRKPGSFFRQPAIMTKDIRLKDYQIVGINWLTLLFEKRLSCILADDMGLGKTCQVIGFLAHLFEIGEKGPHLVVVPSSTLENWLAEFKKFCPALNVLPLYGLMATRREIRDQIEETREDVNVVITTYTVARSAEDFAFLRTFGFCCTIYDEAHSLKSSASQVYQKFIRIRSEVRLLLTGTPLQNNLQELISLLAFLMPKIFRDSMDDLKAIFHQKSKLTDSEALLSIRRIERARQMLVPFILRRKKHQVLKDLPAKTSRIEYCEMTDIQKSIYKDQQDRAKDIMRRRAAGEQMTAKDSSNILMRLRQAAMHPMLFRRIYTDSQLRQISKACPKDERWAHSNPDIILEELQPYSDMETHSLCSTSHALRKFELKNEEWMISGKVDKLVALLRQFSADGHRTLVFSQFVMVMDILELVMQTIKLEFFRLDGGTDVAERQGMIDEFCDPESTVPVFLLSTKAGGAGINLAKANKVIIFDSGFNPQEDIQAENRAHRIGQQQEVEVVRLVTKDTIEEQIYAMGQMKLKLDDRVAGEEEDKEAAQEAAGQKMVEKMLFDRLETDEKTSA